MPDVFRETSSEGYFSRIKNALGGVIFGLVLFVGAFPLTFWNEGRAVKQTQTLQQGEKAVRTVPATPIDAANEGKLVHVTGNVAASEHVVDEAFGIDFAALGLRRKVEMYQWREKKETKEKKKLGGGTETETTYSYERRWDDDAIDSSRFRHPEGHENPGAFPIESRSVAAAEARLGAFRLDRDVLAQIDEWERFDIAQASAAPEGFRRSGDVFYRGADPDSPDVGDVRVRFEAAPEGTYTFVAQQRGEGLGEWLAPAGNALMMIAKGPKEAPAMFAEAHSRNTWLTWILRGAGFFMMWLGLGLVLRPLSVLGDVVPILGNLLGIGVGFVAGIFAFGFSMTTIAIAWFVYRPLLGIALLVAAVGGFWWLRSRGKRVNAATMPHAPPPPPSTMPPPPPPRRA